MNRLLLLLIMETNFLSICLEALIIISLYKQKIERRTKK